LLWRGLILSGIHSVQGSYARVVHAVLRSNETHYAVKIMEKRYIRKENKVNQVGLIAADGAHQMDLGTASENCAPVAAKDDKPPGSWGLVTPRPWGVPHEEAKGGQKYLPSRRDLPAPLDTL
jgi:hypothetical protein